MTPEISKLIRMFRNRELHDDGLNRLTDVMEELLADTKRINWLDAEIENWMYSADFAFQSDEEDGVWFTKIYRHNTGTLPQGLALDSEKSKTVREAIDAAMRDLVFTSLNISL